MKTIIQKYTLSAELLQEGVKDPFGAYKSEGRALYATSHNKYRVKVRNNETGYSMNFIHYGTAAEFKQGITTLSEDRLLNILVYAISKADLGKMSFPSYCDAIGCDPELKASRKAHRACMVLLDKFENDLLMGNEEQRILTELILEPIK